MNKKALHTRKSALALLLILLLAALFLSMDFNYNRGNITGFVINTITTQVSTQSGTSQPASVSVNFAQHIGPIREDFYGANTHGSYLGAGTMIDTNSDGVVDTPSDLAWHRQAWLDSGMKLMRWDALLHNNYFNSTDGSLNFTGNLNSRIAQLKWAHDNGIKVLLVASYMPTWLADTTVTGCNLSELKFCPPYNYTIWENILIDYFDRLTQNGTYSNDVIIEVWNEPDIGFWIGNLPNDHQFKSNQYNLLYNHTYNRLTSHYNNLEIGGPAVSTISDKNLLEGYLSNFSNKMDFFSFHRYNDNLAIILNSDINKALNECQKYNARCQHIIISEWNVRNETIKTDPNKKTEFSSNIAAGYTVLLNNLPSNVSMILFQWSYDKKYLPNIWYEEYPQKWGMVSEPQLDNEYTPAYNVTKNFAHYHAGGDMVVNSSSNNAGIKVVSSYKPNGEKYITIISTNASDINVSVAISGASDIAALKNIETGAVYNVNLGVVNLGTFKQYDVKYFVQTSASVEPNPEPEVPNTPSSNTGGSGATPAANNVPILTGTMYNATSEENMTQNQSLQQNQQNIEPSPEVILPSSDSSANIATDSSDIDKQENIQGSSEKTPAKGILGRVISDITKTGKINVGYTLIIFVLAGIIMYCIVAINRKVRAKRQKERFAELKNWIMKGHELGLTHDILEKKLVEHGVHEEIVKKAIDEHKQDLFFNSVIDKIDKD